MPPRTQFEKSDVMYFYQRCFTSVAIISALSLTGCVYVEDDEDGDGNGYAQYVNLVPQSPDIEFVVDDDSEGEMSFAEATAYSYVIRKIATLSTTIHLKSITKKYIATFYMARPTTLVAWK